LLDFAGGNYYFNIFYPHGYAQYFLRIFSAASCARNVQVRKEFVLNINQRNGGVPEGVDPLIDGVVRARAFFAKNGNTVLISLLAAVVVAAAVLYYNHDKESKTVKAQEVFGVGIMDYSADRFDEALRSFIEAAERYRGTPQGAMGAFMAGSIYLQQRNIDQAVKWFELAVAGGSGSGFVKGQALEGLAAACEEKGDIAAAIKHLERALRDKDAGHRRSAIRWKLALLNKNSANAAAASLYCKELLADTLASSYHQKAENLMAAVNAGDGK
jgi:tetratricopeptide (TPR) repeat protein